jgi:hypothetical protein
MISCSVYEHHTGEWKAHRPVDLHLYTYCIDFLWLVLEYGSVVFLYSRNEQFIIKTSIQLK